MTLTPHFATTPTRREQTPRSSWRVRRIERLFDRVELVRQLARGAHQLGLLFVVIDALLDVAQLAAQVAQFTDRAVDQRQLVAELDQHRELLDQALDVFGISPDVDLDLMAPDQSLASLTARALEGLDAVYAERRPDIVLVQGDTATAMAGGLGASYRRIAVGHVEAGLRTGDKAAPFPEEICRRMISHLADLHFAATEGAPITRATSGTEPKQSPSRGALATKHTIIPARVAADRG